MNSAHPAILAPMSLRLAGLAACAALAVVLNAGAIGIAASASSARANVAASRSDDMPLGTMMLVAAHNELTVSASDPNAASSSATSQTSAAPKLAKLPAANTTPASLQSAPQPVVFYAFHEVEKPAFPESDWNLDIESLDAIGVQRLAFEVLISDRGDVVGCTVLAPADLTDEVKHGLEQRLSATRLLPAERQGQFVASVRRIDLTVSAIPLDVSLAAAAHRP